MTQRNKGRQHQEQPKNPPVLDEMEVLDGLLQLRKVRDANRSTEEKDRISEDLIRRFWTAGCEGNKDARTIVEQVFELQAERLSSWRFRK